MLIADVIKTIEQWAPTQLQESYDNAGLIVGNAAETCTGIICSLDATEEVVDEAIAAGANLVVAHHPIIFSGLKKITGRNYVERTVIKAIRNGISLYACHTNLDNLMEGVNGRMADRLGLINRSILAPKSQTLKKLYTFCPVHHAEKLRQTLFAAGAGQLGNYSSCSFNTEGEGTFKAGEGANPFVGEIGELHRERELRIEVVFPAHLESTVVRAMRNAHPYEEVAFDVVTLSNTHPTIGAGLLGELPEAIEYQAFLKLLQQQFNLSALKYTRPPARPVKRVALCGGAGSFLISSALASRADAFVTADVKYHEFFDADGNLLLVDIGHYESEQFTIGLLQEFLVEKFTTFAVLKTKVETNPVRYFPAES